MKLSRHPRVWRIAVVVSVLGFVFPVSAQLVTNQPARFKTKIVLNEGKLGSSTSVNPSPQATSPGNEVTDTGTTPGREYELKWKYLGQKGDKDSYRFTFTRTTKDGDSNVKMTTSKEVLFNGGRATVFEDTLHTVIIESPSAADLK